MRMQKLWCSSEEPFDFIQWIAENHRKGVLLISGTEMIDFLTTNLDLIYSPSLENDELEFQSKDFKIKLSFTIILGDANRSYYLLDFFQNADARQLYMPPDNLKKIQHIYLIKYHKKKFKTQK